MNSSIKSFTGHQKKVLTALFICYLCAYVGRLNMSATLGDIIEEFDISESKGGLLQTAFAVSYALGQFVFGYLADRFEPKRMISAGLLGSAACNVIYSVMPSFSCLLAVWTVNGIFQSMIWTPIVLCMACVFEKEKRKSASFVMSFTLAAGHFAAWALSIWLAEKFTWRLSYRVPAVVLTCAAGVALTMLPGGITSSHKQEKRGDTPAAPIRELAGTGLVFLLICCVLNGFVRDSVITWAGKILDSGKNANLSKLMIPCINLLGILLGAYLVRSVKMNIRTLVGVMMGSIAVPAVIAAICGDGTIVLAQALLLGIMSAILYGTNPLLTTLIPMQYDKFGRVGLAAGLVDCFIYVGSAMSGPVTGALHEASGKWSVVYVMWAFVMVAGCVLAGVSGRNRKINE